MKVRFALAVLAACSMFSVETRAQLSDAERKATARAAYHEGITLQERGNAAEALARFEAAQSVFPAPTHVLHIAQCQALVGKLVEASETYELLARTPLAPDAPEAFVSAKDKGRTELAQLRPRIPTLKITLQPQPNTLGDLRVLINDSPIPMEIVGIARPVNPGRYRIAASGTGWRSATPIELVVLERETRTAEVVLQAEPTVIAATAGGIATLPAPRPTPERYEAQDSGAPQGPSTFGLLLGLRPLLAIPAGKETKAAALNDSVGTGGGIGIDAIARLSRIFLVGGTLELANLGTADALRSKLPANVTPSASTSYVGLFIGIMPNVDRVTFIADAGLGWRSLSTGVEQTGQQGASLRRDVTASALDVAFNAGLSFPIGRFRVAPKAGFSFGTFSSVSCSAGATGCGTIDPANRDTHLFAQLSVGLYYHVDFNRR